MDSTRGRSTLHVSLDHNIKPGLSLVDYADPKCPELSMAKHKQKKGIGLIKQNIKQKLQGNSNENEKKRYVMQHLQTPRTYCIKHLPQTQRNLTLDFSGDCSTSSDVPSTTGLSGRFNNESHIIEKFRGNDGDDQVTIQYKYKTSKDFIPVFPLKGKPKYLDEWLNRKRKWPPTDIVTDEYNSEFFVVAKPAPVEPSKVIDFCLAYNIREVKLAKAMTQLQKNVILIIKALQKSSLRDYCEIVTTFHWKTVVYWVSENTETQILENRTEDNIHEFLQNILKYMVDCLCYNYLRHYFVPCNLFVGIHEDKIHDINTRRRKPNAKDSEPKAKDSEPNAKDSKSPIILALSGSSKIRNSLIDRAVSWLLDEMHSTEAPNVEDCSGNKFVLEMQKLLSGNWF
ncbi:Hypothetical predicted protein [Mytilus galloprovincialis]|uniref:Mab-21-like HhH/H2TH-like domain-containing protein n=1 Tax=Mytilus galloprovincialis TaxID=29158 RepID=A0A8B6GVZ1_MYTGA|nr:Hypothetical predicted protein [Mytilus galloprovincialis]